MSEPLRAHDPDGVDPDATSDDAEALASVPGGMVHESAQVEHDLTVADLMQRAREHAEAEAAVAAVMEREGVKAAAVTAREQHKRRQAPLKLLLLGALVAFNLYAWAGNPTWLHYNEPRIPSVDYYESSWKMAVYLQRQRIEEYRLVKGHLPATAQQAGPTVRGVQYKPIESKTYELAAGDGAKKFVYRSTDTLSMIVGRALAQMTLLSGGAR
jgi:hypothetical protein